MARSLRRFIAVAQTEISNFDNEIARQAEMAKRAIEQVAEYTSGQVQREAEVGTPFMSSGLLTVQVISAEEQGGQVFGESRR